MTYLSEMQVAAIGRVVPEGGACSVESVNGAIIVTLITEQPPAPAAPQSWVIAYDGRTLEL